MLTNAGIGGSFLEWFPINASAKVAPYAGFQYQGAQSREPVLMGSSRHHIVPTELTIDGQAYSVLGHRADVNKDQDQVNAKLREENRRLREALLSYASENQETPPSSDDAKDIQNFLGDRQQLGMRAI
jgi:hypothetical protein